MDSLIGSSVLGAWIASISTAPTAGAFSALTIAFSGALTMLYVGQRRQRQMLLESIELARSDRDQCREELAELKTWLGDSLPQRRKNPR